MSVQNTLTDQNIQKPQDTKSSTDKTSASSQQTQNQPVSVRETKEQDTTGGEKQILESIVKESAQIDRELEGKVRSEIKEARLADVEPEIPKDVAESGVKAPSLEAAATIKAFNLPITEGEYKVGLHQKVAGAVVNKVVVGVSSLAGLALWVGRKIKMAHKHAIRIVFRREAGK